MKLDSYDAVDIVLREMEFVSDDELTYYCWPEGDDKLNYGLEEASSIDPFEATVLLEEIVLTIIENLKK